MSWHGYGQTSPLSIWSSRVALERGLVEPGVELLRRVYADEEPHVHPSGEVVAVVFVGQRAEVQPLQQLEVAARRPAQLDRSADVKSARPEYLVDDRGQVVLPVAAAPLGALPLAEHAAPTTGEVEVVQVYVLDLGPGALGALRCRLQGLCGVPGLPRACV